MPGILLVEDDRYLSGLVVDTLTAQQHTVQPVYDGEEAWSLLQVQGFDLLILDWDLPGRSGLEILQGCRRLGNRVPILMLTGKDTVIDKETGLDAGADDYLCKPFQMRELSARVRAMLRRAAGSTDNTLKAGNLVLYLDAHRVTVAGQDAELTPKEFAVLELLLRYPDQVFSADQLMERVWSWDSTASAETVKTTVQRLRKKVASVDKGGIAIDNIYGVGYKLRLT